jgi:hypothetical protein
VSDIVVPPLRCRSFLAVTLSWHPMPGAHVAGVAVRSTWNGG